MASKSSILLVVVLVLVGVLLPACTDRRASPGEEADGDRGYGQQDAQERSSASYQERTVAQDQRDMLTGIITKGGEGSYILRKKPGYWILVEENPSADCQGDKGPRNPGCEKIYFDIVNSTRVLWENGSARTAAHPTDLKKGQRVSADYTGYDVAMSYPSYTDARTVVIMGTP